MWKKEKEKKEKKTYDGSGDPTLGNYSSIYGEGAEHNSLLDVHCMTSG